MTFDSAKYQNNPLSVIQVKNTHIEKCPYRHIHIENFFDENYFEDLYQEFQKIKLRELSENYDVSRFFRLPDNDFYNYYLPPNVSYPFQFFYSPEWLNYFKNLFSINLCNDVFASLNHHSSMSKDIYIHNDFNRVCFKHEPLANGINPFYAQTKYYLRRDEKDPEGLLIRRRAIAVIIYFNKDWQEGDGGETSMFTGREENTLLKKIPPKANSLLAFEISPISFHGFISNKKDRDSLAQMFHVVRENVNAM